MRTRTAVSLVENPPTLDETLLWYSRAIGVMRKRKFTDPTSWRFQAAMHDYNPATDPYRDPADPAPSSSVQRTYFRQCQHSSWFFLSWHRMYLYFFEKIVADAVVEAGGPAGWTLPYWDYEQAGLARKLPWAFRQPTWPNGETNYLYVSQRAPGYNEGTAGLSDQDVEAATALKMKLFSTDPSSPDVQFGGPRVKNHDGGAYPFGGVESSPHNHVHVAVGGPRGFMYDPAKAGLDPIFWVHHCNIDRLWELWRQNAFHLNPSQATWGTTAFPFHDEKKLPTTMTSSQVVSVRSLGYEYQGVGPPPTLPKPPLLKPLLKPTLFAATGARSLVRGPLHHEEMAPPAPAPAAPARVLLHLENVKGKQTPGAYDVFVNLPDGYAEGAAPDHCFAGRVTLFGGDEARRRTRNHAREGFSFVLDITDRYQELLSRGEWRPDRVKITLRRVYDWSDEAEIGRISVSVA